MDGVTPVIDGPRLVRLATNLKRLAAGTLPADMWPALAAELRITERVIRAQIDAEESRASR